MNAPSTQKTGAERVAELAGKQAATPELNSAPSKQNLAESLGAQAAGGTAIVPTTGGQSNLPATANVDTWETFMQANRKSFEMVLPTHFRNKGGTDKLIRLALTSLRRNPALMQCSMPSLAASILDCCALGLEFNSPLRQAHIIPFKNNKTKTVEAQLVIDYHGLIDLHLRSSAVQSIFADVVWEADRWSFSHGTDEHLSHTPAHCAAEERGKRIGVYAYAKLASGGTPFVWLWEHQVNTIRDEYSAGYKADKENSPWVTNTDSMWRKTAVRALSTWIPKSADAERARAIDETSSEKPRIGEERAFSDAFTNVAGGIAQVVEPGR